MATRLSPTFLAPIHEATLKSYWRRQAPRRFLRQTTLKGKPAVVSKAVVSADGKTRTLTQIGVNAKGQKVNNVLVYEKQ